MQTGYLSFSFRTMINDLNALLPSFSLKSSVLNMIPSFISLPVVFVIDAQLTNAAGSTATDKHARQLRRIKCRLSISVVIMIAGIS